LREGREGRRRGGVLGGWGAEGSWGPTTRQTGQGKLSAGRRGCVRVAAGMNLTLRAPAPAPPPRAVRQAARVWVSKGGATAP